MKDDNPWLNIPYADYERHMTHPDVGQLQQLNAIIEDKVKQFAPKMIAVLGACTGNGFEHFRNAEMIYAIDINPDYLKVCGQRFGHYGNSLKCIAADIDNDGLGIPPGTVDLVVCQLLLEYVDAEAALKIIHKMLSPDGVFNVVIQENKSKGFVSNTGISSLAPLSTFGKSIEEQTLLNHTDFKIINLAEYQLPNGKLFKSYDFKKV